MALISAVLIAVLCFDIQVVRRPADLEQGAAWAAKTKAAPGRPPFRPPVGKASDRGALSTETTEEGSGGPSGLRFMAAKLDADTIARFRKWGLDPVPVAADPDDCDAPVYGVPIDSSGFVPVGFIRDKDGRELIVRLELGPESGSEIRSESESESDDDD